LQAEDNNREDTEALPLIYDAKYNIVVCINCNIGIPFDWIQGHLKDNHGIRTTENEALEHIGQAIAPIDSTQVANWIESNSVIRIAIEGIPMVHGFKCSLCSHYTLKRRSMTVHLSTQHRNLNGTAMEAMIQRPFGGWFKKYIEVREVTEADIIEEEAWKDELNRRFENALRIDSSEGSAETTDMRLMNAFIAKVRCVCL